MAKEGIFCGLGIDYYEGGQKATIDTMIINISSLI